ncbi:MAG: hypothetical protein FWG03_08820 [Clostridiales bacterium]|nr:hypothetical protein [Clostridiales bacterium]
MKNRKWILTWVVVFALLAAGFGGCSYIDKFLDNELFSDDYVEETSSVSMPDDSYLGVWYRNENDLTKELTIIEIGEDGLVFNLGIERLASIDGTARVEGDVIKLTGVDPAEGEVYGTMVFDNRTITVSIDKADWTYDLKQKIRFTYHKGSGDETAASDANIYVYDADYEYTVPVDSYTTKYGEECFVTDIRVPYIDFDSADAQMANAEIKQIFNEAIRFFKEGTNDKLTYVDTCNYSSYLNEDTVSVNLVFGIGGTGVVQPEYYTWNFDVSTGRLLRYDDVYMRAGFDGDLLKERVELEIKHYLVDVLQVNKTKNTEATIKNYKTSVEENTIKYFLDGDKNLNILVTFIIPAGSGNISRIITVLTEDREPSDLDDEIPYE